MVSQKCPHQSLVAVPDNHVGVGVNQKCAAGLLNLYLFDNIRDGAQLNVRRGYAAGAAIFVV